jgi:hypothetical protein
MFPTDAKLLNRAREILVRLAKGAGIKLHQFYHRVGKFALIKHQRYARPSNSSAPRRPYLGRVIREVARRDEESKVLSSNHRSDGIFWGRLLAFCGRGSSRKSLRKPSKFRE